jgi:hypothetical protein
LRRLERIIFLDFPAWASIHKIIFKFYLYSLIPLINFFSNVGSFEPRFSLRSREHFNLFLSDLDLLGTLSLATEAAESNMRRYIKLWKTFIPSIGELEIYQLDEKIHREVLLKQYGYIYEPLRRFRKVWWMEYSYSQSKSIYHKYKALRAIQICLNIIAPALAAHSNNNLPQLSSHLEQFITNIFEDIHLNVPLKDIDKTQIYCPYMGATIHINVDYKVVPNNGYTLSPRAGILLLAISPVSFRSDRPIDKIIAEVRRNPRIKIIAQSLCKLEILIFKGVFRAQPKVLPWMTQWQTSLEEAESELSKI